MKDFTVSINLFLYYDDDNNMDEEKVRADIINALKAGLNNHSMCDYDPIYEEDITVKRY